MVTPKALQHHRLKKTSYKYGRRQNYRTELRSIWCRRAVPFALVRLFLFLSCSRRSGSVPHQLVLLFEPRIQPPPGGNRTGSCRGSSPAPEGRWTLVFGSGVLAGWWFQHVSTNHIRQWDPSSQEKAFCMLQHAWRGECVRFQGSLHLNMVAGHLVDVDHPADRSPVLEEVNILKSNDVTSGPLRGQLHPMCEHVRVQSLFNMPHKYGTGRSRVYHRGNRIILARSPLGNWTMSEHQ